MITRRKFVKQTLQAAAGSSLLLSSMQACKPRTIAGSMQGPNAALGHKLRAMQFDPPSENIHTSVVIVGGGVAGLSAARYLKRATNDFILLELGDDTGGNSIGGSNAAGAYPWGAHYLPLPGNNDPELMAFLQDAQVITGYENDLPVYNEYYLCFDPKERLYINHYWQDGIIPHEGIGIKDREQIERFLAMMNDFRQQLDADGREAFAIPVDCSSQDAKYRQLDAISMETFLQNNGFTSPYLHWYVNYCCADDYGSSLTETSAWAGIHYFASRKGKAANASYDSVLTWPEGNYWLVKQLRKNIASHIYTGALAYHIEPTNTGVDILYYDAVKKQTIKISAQTAIVATPQFVNQRMLPGKINRSLDYTRFEYAPWMVANITLSASLEERKGEQLCWDNVIYGSDAVGYVNASHQLISFVPEQNIITYYKPLLGKDIRAIRQQAYQRNWNEWKDIILKDLQQPHPRIEQYIERMDIWVWGHGMIKPSPGFIWSADRKNAAAPVGEKIFFAHSDLSGISIFEHAFYHGHTAARQALNALLTARSIL
ncbi:MAG TPA: FAD/NAD(P)-binding protein [Ohtaekwangia sp.]|uniref:FAD/NAD(P)-binding protein n=1 Tax=Ohtaekwangia sp. TaxID=2066019 RepID=UPI002F95870F